MKKLVADFPQSWDQFFASHEKPDFFTCEDDGVVGIVAPQLYEVNDITKSETWMATKHDTRLEQRA